jgi:hypothetical protein
MDVMDISSAGQLIPMIISIGLLCRIIYVGFICGETLDTDFTPAEWDDIPPVGMARADSPDLAQSLEYEVQDDEERRNPENPELGAERIEVVGDRRACQSL